MLFSKLPLLLQTFDKKKLLDTLVNPVHKTKLYFQRKCETKRKEEALYKAQWLRGTPAGHGRLKINSEIDTEMNQPPYFLK